MEKYDLLIKVLEMLLNSNAQEKKGLNDLNEYDYKIGENYFIRTVTHILVGKLVHKTDQELILNNCSWIADTGRYHDALKTGNLNEIEPYPSESLVHVNRASFIDAVIWEHELPKDQK